MTGTETMRAVRITSPGRIEKLEIQQVERPRATADRVRIRVRAAALNRADLLQRMGRYPAPADAPPDVPGLEFAGEVDQTGPESQRWRVGQRVFGITGGGAQAEFVVVPEAQLAEVPEDLDWAEAAAMPEAFITAYDALFTQGNLKVGERVLVHAVGSGVGLAAVQLARAAGAGSIYGTARTPEKIERARHFGLDEAVAIGADANQIVAAVRAWTAGAGVHLVLDLVGAAYTAANLEALAPLGRMLMVGTLGGARAELDISVVMRKRLRLIGTVLRSRTAAEKASATRDFIEHVVPLVARGQVRPVIDSTYRLEEVREAHARLESNMSFGKVVLLID